MEAARKLSGSKLAQINSGTLIFSSQRLMWFVTLLPEEAELFSQSHRNEEGSIKKLLRRWIDAV